MHRRQAAMETLRRACKREFDSEFGGCPHCGCPHCGTHVLSNLSRHIMDYHLELGQLWQCPVEWCSVWKGTAQDCLDHLDVSVELKMLGKYFPPWTVTRETWHTVRQTSCYSTSMVAGILFIEILCLMCPWL